MNRERPATTAAHRVTSGTGRLRHAWSVLSHERRLAAFASLGLFAALFLPWYHETVVAVGRTASVSVTGWQAFSFVEAAVLLVAAGVLTLLFQRAEGRAFHLPGGDGGVIAAAGFWTCALVVWRIFDKQSVQVRGPGTAVSGIEWGILVALAVAAFLAYSGSRIRRGPLSPRRLQHEREVGADRADHKDARDDQRPGLRDVPHDRDQQPRRERGRERAQVGGLHRKYEDGHG